MEFVFVVPRGDLFPDCYPHGLVPFGEECSLESFERAVVEYGFFVERPRAEVEPAWKQVIPYTALVRGSDIFLVLDQAFGTITGFKDRNRAVLLKLSYLLGL